MGWRDRSEGAVIRTERVLQNVQIRLVTWSRWDGTLASSLSSLVLCDQHTAPRNLGITQNTGKVPDDLCWFLHLVQIS